MTTEAHRTSAPEQGRIRHGSRRRGIRLTRTAALASLVPVVLAAIGGPPAAAALAARTGTAAAGRAGPGWARLADRVPTPALHWATCHQTDQCASAELPLDYRDPHGAKITVALLRVPALDPRHRLGSIFVNPGGPGDPARSWAALLPRAVPKVILDRFDIVGVDPRGAGGSTPIRCFGALAAQLAAMAPFTATPFPGTPAQQRSWIGAAQVLGRSCAARARSIASAMSTTDDALDMDVLRRAVGDHTLTYFGESYGSYLGLVYANMFPGRVRAIAIDGIVNPLALAGTPATAHVPVLDRMGSAAASYRALRELLGADSRNAAAATSWPAAAAAADRRARYFGAFYAWLTVQCARHTWTARDRDAYQGPFDRRTAAPVLVIGGKWDPATSYGNAVTVARLLPNSRLVASGSWGHEAAGTSACVDDTLWDYLIQPQAPAPKVTRCRGNVQPFGPAPSAR